MELISWNVTAVRSLTVMNYSSFFSFAVCIYNTTSSRKALLLKQVSSPKLNLIYLWAKQMYVRLCYGRLKLNDSSCWWSHSSDESEIRKKRIHTDHNSYNMNVSDCFLLVSELSVSVHVFWLFFCIKSSTSSGLCINQAHDNFSYIICVTLSILL